jgi:peroxiredoxin
MRNTLIIICFGLLLLSCGENARNTKITGKLDNSANETVYLQELTVTGDGAQDSVKLSGSGKFKFALKINQPAFYKLRIANQKAITLIVQPGSRVRLEGDAQKLYESYVVEGSQESLQAQALDRRMDKTVKGIDSLNVVYRQFLNNPNIVNITKTLQNNYYNLLDEQRNFTIDFIQKHPSSLASIMALYQQTGDSVFVLYKADDTKYYSMVDSLIYPKYPRAPYVKALHNNIENIKNQYKQQELKKIMSSLGGPAQNISMPDPSGKSVSLSSFKGSPVILYFWASWCDSCRNHNTQLLTLYDKFKSKGLKIMAVSLDLNKEVWQAAIKKDKVGAWTHVSDLKYWNSPVVATYNIENIPLFFLIDKEGTVISRSVSPSSMENSLNTLLK